MEVVVSVGAWASFNTSSQFASILLHMDVEEGNGSFGLFLHGELDLCALTIQMSKENLVAPCRYDST